jgi:hypothetical protein
MRPKMRPIREGYESKLEELPPEDFREFMLTFLRLMKTYEETKGMLQV